MGLETRSTSNTTYLQLDHGRKSMYIYSPEEREGYEKHTTKNDKVSYRKYINAVSGKIVGAYFKDSNLGGKEFVLVFSDKDERYSLQISISNSVFQSLARSINNIDTSEVVKLSIYESKSQTNKTKTFFGLSLTYPEKNDERIEWGEELPKGKKKRSGEWDFSEVEDAAYERIEKFIKDNKFDSKEDVAKNATVDEGGKKQVFASDEDDDLPF